ncbi:hypothetical protein ACIP3U_12460 [[Kitasatospora] papulosa]|uniref:hypothetical protein n=1 Tax=[Kitasatospora] papulosa TaxID=1464011 RepID=UPI00381F25BB
MRAVLGEAPLVEDVDVVGMADAGHAVGDQDNDPVRGGEAADAVEGSDLGFGVERGGRLVDDEDAVLVRCRAAPVGAG